MKKLILFGPVFLIIVILAVWFIDGMGDVVQPIQYNHFVHVQEEEIECLECHQYAEDYARASIPNIDECADCHDESELEDEEEMTSDEDIIRQEMKRQEKKILFAYMAQNKKIPWRQVNNVPNYAYFSHRRHVKLGGIECVECHGDTGKQTTPIVRPHETRSMAWCMDCHEKENVSNDCYACHH